MKLTPEQIDHVKYAILCSRPDVLYPGALTLAAEALDAFRRVEAYAENLDTMTTLDQTEHRRNMQVAASIRRALYGRE